MKSKIFSLIIGFCALFALSCPSFGSPTALDQDKYHVVASDVCDNVDEVSNLVNVASETASFETRQVVHLVDVSFTHSTAIPHKASIKLGNVAHPVFDPVAIFYKSDKPLLYSLSPSKLPKNDLAFLPVKDVGWCSSNALFI